MAFSPPSVQRFFPQLALSFLNLETEMCRLRRFQPSVAQVFKPKDYNMNIFAVIIQEGLST